MRALVLLTAFLLGLASPARTADDVAAAQTVIRSQVGALGRDDAATAYSFAAPAIRDMFPQADIFTDMVRQSYAPVYRHKSFEFGEARVSRGQIAQRVHIIDAEGAVGGAVYAGGTAGWQREDHRLCFAQGGPGGIKRFRAKACSALDAGPGKVETGFPKGSCSNK